MIAGADRMCMPAPTVDQFLDAVKSTVLANRRWVPPAEKGALYVRPLLFGSGATLGVKPTPDFTFLAYASPVGKYHKVYPVTELRGCCQVPLNLLIEAGFIELFLVEQEASNVLPIIHLSTRQNQKGFPISYVWMQPREVISRSSASNIFLVKGNVISTPSANGTILPGITRKGVMDLASLFSYKVEVHAIPVEELLGAERVFCTGTAMAVQPVSAITYRDKGSNTRSEQGQSASNCMRL